MKQLVVKLSLPVDVTPEQAWNLIGAVDGVDKWFNSMIKSCRVEGNKRYCETKDGVLLKEDILQVDHQSRTFRFAIPEQDLLPAQNIVEVMQVKEGGSGKAIIECTATFEATEDKAEIAKESFRNLWSMAFKELEEYVLLNETIDSKAAP